MENQRLKMNHLGYYKDQLSDKEYEYYRDTLFLNGFMNYKKSSTNNVFCNLTKNIVQDTHVYSSCLVILQSMRHEYK